MKTSNKKKRYYIAGGIVAIIIILAFMKSCGVFGTNEKIDIVTTEPVGINTIIQSVTASGKIKPETEVKIAPEVSGEIIELTAKLKESQSEYNRSKSLFESGTIAKADWETAETNYKVAKLTYEASKSSLESARASLKEAEDNLTRTRIYAPIDGTISKLNVEKGERVVGTAQMAGTEVLRVANLDVMEVEVTVGENDIVKIAVGNPVTIEVDAYWGKKFKGVITEIGSSAANETTASSSADQVTNFNVQIIILEDSYRELAQSKNMPHTPFKPGMTASVDIEASKKDSIITVPIKAVTTRQIKDTLSGTTDTKEIVFTLADGKAKRNIVETGIQDDENIEIISGIEKDQTIITGPYSLVSKTLDDGRTVKSSSDKSDAKGKK